MQTLLEEKAAEQRMAVEWAKRRTAILTQLRQLRAVVTHAGKFAGADAGDRVRVTVDVFQAAFAHYQPWRRDAGFDDQIAVKLSSLTAELRLFERQCMARSDKRFDKHERRKLVRVVERWHEVEMRYRRRAALGWLGAELW